MHEMKYYYLHINDSYKLLCALVCVCVLATPQNSSEETSTHMFCALEDLATTSVGANMGQVMEIILMEAVTATVS